MFIDGFAGGGGASTGIAQAIGREVDIAINHSHTAIAIHAANHPQTEHLCTDIRQPFLPRQVTRHREVAGAWFSPDCKEFSKAKGGPVKDRSIRALCWEVVHWLDEVRPTCGYLENVEEFEYAAPLDADGRPIAGQEGREFRRFVRSIRALGYRVRWFILRACDYGAPTSRKRLYMVMRRDGLPIVKPKPTHGAPGSPGVRSGKLLSYRTAAECIDWAEPCPSIFGRKKELADATKRRIAHGVMRYVVDAARPFIVGTAFTNTRAARTFDPQDPVRTVTTQAEFGVVDAQVAPHITKFRTGSIGSAADLPMPTVTANGEPARPAGASPLGVVGAVLAPHVASMANREKPFSAADEPMHTVVATGCKKVMVGTTLAPFVTYGQHGGHSRAVDEPHHTVAASAKDTNGLAAATLVKMGNGEREGQDPRALDLGKPLGTVTATGSQGAAVTAAMAPLIDRQFGNSTPAPADEPIGATTAGGGGKSAAVTAFLSSMYTSNTNGGRGKPDLPLKTILAGANHHSVVAAHLEQANTMPHGGIHPGHSASKPLSTIVGKGSTQRLVETTMIEEGDLPPALMESATRVAAFLVKYYGTDGENEVAQSQAADRPLDCITTKARFAVVTVTIDAKTYVIVDIGLRMLRPRELARAQGFPDTYVLDPECWYTTASGKQKFGRLPLAAQISAIGNSVCPPVARALVAANQPCDAAVRAVA
nr:DNA cytosine methyltransferase [Sphingomonas jinjuensis]